MVVVVPLQTVQADGGGESEDRYQGENREQPAPRRVHGPIIRIRPTTTCQDCTTRQTRDVALGAQANGDATDVSASIAARGPSPANARPVARYTDPAKAALPVSAAPELAPAHHALGRPEGERYCESSPIRTRLSHIELRSVPRRRWRRRGRARRPALHHERRVRSADRRAAARAGGARRASRRDRRRAGSDGRRAARRLPAGCLPRGADSAGAFLRRGRSGRDSDDAP